MTAWRLLGVTAIGFLMAGVAGAQTVTLAEEVKSGECFRVRLEMKLTGEMRVSQNGKLTPLSETAVATHDFTERILVVDKGATVSKSARRYATAKATITVGRDRSVRALHADRGVVVAQHVKDQCVLFCPTMALTHEELEALEHMDTLAAIALLPGKAVKVQDTWKIPSSAVQALCHFEGLTEHSLQGTLIELTEDAARFTVAGTASGIDLGAMVKSTIDATCCFDRKTKRLTRVEWKQKDERDQGPASPASTVDVTSTMQRSLIDAPDTLSDVALVSVPDGSAEPPAHMTQVQLTDPKSRFDLTHAREWTLVGQTDEHVILRLMERGDFVAQATITPWESADKGKHMDPEKFRDMMAKTPGWEMEKEVQVGEVSSDGGRWMYRVSATGQLDGSNVLQNFYLIAGSEGEQVVIVFTLSPKQADRLGSRDLSLAGSIEFPKKKP
jgi:hypothetical protein